MAFSLVTTRLRYKKSVINWGREAALLFSKLEARIFRPALAALDPALPTPLPLATALEQVEQTIDELVKHAHLEPAKTDIHHVPPLP
jgi:hypothetical protein